MIAFRYVTEDAELDRAFAAMNEILASGAWRRWVEQATVVT